MQDVGSATPPAFAGEQHSTSRRIPAGLVSAAAGGCLRRPLFLASAVAALAIPATEAAAVTSRAAAAAAAAASPLSAAFLICSSSPPLATTTTTTTTTKGRVSWHCALLSRTSPVPPPLSLLCRYSRRDQEQHTLAGGASLLSTTMVAASSSSKRKKGAAGEEEEGGGGQHSGGHATGGGGEEGSSAVAGGHGSSSSSSQKPGTSKTKKSKTTTTTTKSTSDDTASRRYFLMKSEPHVFSVEDLEAKEGRTSEWEGVRNYQARNIMRDQMRVGDRAFFYHSSCKVPGIVGVVEVCRSAYPDHTQFDPKSDYYDAGSSKDNPRWMMVDVRLVRKLGAIVSLEEMKKYKEEGQPLHGMVLLQKSRLSVQPVTEAQWDFITNTLITTQDNKDDQKK